MQVESTGLVIISTQLEMLVFVSKTVKKLYSALQLIMSDNKIFEEI